MFELGSMIVNFDKLISNYVFLSLEQRDIKNEQGSYLHTQYEFLGKKSEHDVWEVLLDFGDNSHSFNRFREYLMRRVYSS